MDLIRDILFAVEAHGSSGGFVRVAIEGHWDDEINYHLVLLKDAGFMECVVLESSDGIMVQPLRLTWTGHEFIDAARSSKVWNGAKAFVLKTTGTLTLEGLKMAIPHVLKTMMGV